MRIIDAQSDLDALCQDLAGAPYVTVDTEFMRERTYWAVLCLIQISPPCPDGAPEPGVLIDPLAKGLDLTPFFDLMRNPSVMKVFHAARQDIEILHHMGDAIPRPVFDTQVAAMVCGYGDQVGYETLARQIAGASIDKSSRFTDWSRRPLSGKQKAYALADVTHLRDIYESLSARVDAAGRAHWMDEEIAILTTPATYETRPEDAWRRLKLRNAAPKFISAVRALADWREREAQSRDAARSRVLSDDALLELAASRPKSMGDLGESRSLRREHRDAKSMQAILEVLSAAGDAPMEDAPPPPPPRPDASQAAVAELLRVMLKARAAELGVAPRLLASSADLERLAIDDAPDIPALSGWRREAFGADALRMKRGELALSGGDGGVKLIEIQG